MSVLAVVAGLGVVLMPSALASHTPTPTSVTVAGNFQSELGCSGDWEPGCAMSHLARDANDDVWKGTWTLPSASYEYKAALNNTWDENYGLHAQENGANIPLTSDGTTPVTFFYDHKTHWITDTTQGAIATVAGNFQSELGCSGDWDPACMRSWLQDPDGDGTYTFTTTSIPAGNYEVKVAIDRSWDVNYGAGGVLNGANIAFSVPSSGVETCFSSDSASHVLTVTTSCTPTPTLTINDVSVNEGNSGTTSFTFTVSLSAPATDAGVTLNYTTADASATIANGDYIAQTGTRNIPAGSSTSTISVSGNGDTTIEPDETFFVNVTSADGASILDAQGQGTIVNDDAEPYQILGFFSPYSKSKWKVGTTVAVKIALALNGVRISDTEASALLSPTCRVFFSAGSTPAVPPTCMKYDALNKQFVYNWKVAKSTTPTAPATIPIMVTVKNADDTTNATLSEPIMLTAK